MKLSPLSNFRQRTVEVLFTAVLIVSTYVFAEYFPRYQIVSDELLVNGSFENQFEGWQIQGEGVEFLKDTRSLVRLGSTDEKRAPNISQIVMGLRENTLLLLSGEVKTDSVVMGNRSWKTARLRAVQKAELNSAHSPQDVLISAVGTSSWREVSSVFRIQPARQSIEVSFELLQATGIAYIDNVSLHEVVEQELYTPLVISIFALWSALGCWFLYSISQRFGIFSRHGLIAMLAILLVVGVLVSTETRNAVWHPIATFLNFDSNSLGTASGDHSHYAGFVLVTLLALSLVRRVKASANSVFYLVVFAISTETLQLLSDDRSASAGDLGIDLLGIFTAWCLWAVWVQWHRVYSKTRLTLGE